MCVEALFYQLLGDVFRLKSLIFDARTNLLHCLRHFFARGVREGNVENTLSVAAGERGGFGDGFAKVLG